MISIHSIELGSIESRKLTFYELKQASLSMGADMIVKLLSLPKGSPSSKSFFKAMQCQELRLRVFFSGVWQAAIFELISPDFSLRTKFLKIKLIPV